MTLPTSPSSAAPSTAPRAAADSRPPGRRPGLPSAVLLAVLVGALVVGAPVSLALGPRSPALGQARSGDPQLVADVEATLITDRGYQALSVARVRAGQVAFAGLGTASGEVPSPQTPFELGSITKTITGALLADAVQRREMRLDAPVSTYLRELAGTPAGAATLAELATHTSGLPEFPPDLASATALRSYANDNPYATASTAELLAAARTTPVTERAGYRYSNLGMSLLGHAEARAAKAPNWPTLATRRVLRPLGMASTTFALTAADVPVTPATPRRDNGWPVAYWYGEAFTPAGSSTWTTASDLARYAAAVLDGRAPGQAALEPRTRDGADGIGLAWHVRERNGRQITWHNGATGGYRSMLALDRERRQAVLVLGDTTRWTDQIALSLAATAADQAPAATARLRPPAPPALVLPLVGLLALGTFAWYGLRGRNRLTLADGGLWGVTGLLILLVHGPWGLVPAWIWGGLAGVASVVGVLATRRARRLPPLPARRPLLSVLSLLVTAGVLALVIWTM